MRRRSPTLILAALLFTLGTTPVLAGGTRLDDGDDTRGVLDIARISHGHHRHELVHTIRLREAWPVKKLRRHGFAVIYFELPGHPGNPPERTVQIEYEKGRLVARMYASLGDPSKHLGRVTLRRPDWRTLRVTFPKSMLRKGLQRYKWNSVTFVEKGEGMCPRGGGCTDWAPNLSRGLRYVRHTL